MKQILLAFSLCFLFSFTYGQGSSGCYGCGFAQYASAFENNIAVYPNPATEFIKLKDVRGVGAIKIYNLIGREVKTFTSIAKGSAYNVSDLPNGMYLVQLIDLGGKIKATHRMNKR